MEGFYEDLDAAIIAFLPDQGAKRGKYLPDARTTRQIADELDDPEVKPPNLARRLQELAKDGLVVPVVGITDNGRHLWQRTPKGTAFLERKERSHEHAGN